MGLRGQCSREKSGIRHKGIRSNSTNQLEGVQPGLSAEAGDRNWFWVRCRQRRFHRRRRNETSTPSTAARRPSSERCRRSKCPRPSRGGWRRDGWPAGTRGWPPRTGCCKAGAVGGMPPGENHHWKYNSLKLHNLMLQLLFEMSYYSVNRCSHRKKSEEREREAERKKPTEIMRNYKI